MTEEERLVIAKERIEYILKTYNVNILYSDIDGWCMESIYLCCLDDNFDPINLKEISNV